MFIICKMPPKQKRKTIVRKGKWTANDESFVRNVFQKGIENDTERGINPHLWHMSNWELRYPERHYTENEYFSLTTVRERLKKIAQEVILLQAQKAQKELHAAAARDAEENGKQLYAF